MAKVINRDSHKTKACVSNGIITVLHVGKTRNSTNTRTKMIDKRPLRNMSGKFHT